MVQIVNAVGSGSLATEFDLEQVSRALGPVAEYDPEKYPGMYLRLSGDKPLITVYRTGKYIVTGAESEAELHRVQNQFLRLLSDEQIPASTTDDDFSVQNLVCTAELDEVQNLNALAIGLGLGETEYEPEQFPGLIYRSDDYPCVLLIFATGKVVITGSTDLEMATEAFDDLEKRIDQLTGEI